MADERARLTGEPQPIPDGHRWADLAAPQMEGVELEQHYRETPRVLIDAIVDCVRPQPGEVIADPACGTGGFLLSAHEYVRDEPGTHADMVITNPPFGKKSSITVMNEVGESDRQTLTYNRPDFWTTTSNKQLAGDKVSLDIFWLRDESLEDSASLPEPHLLAQEIADDLRSALAQIEDVLGDLEQRVGTGDSEEA
jgi:23S rRNA G2445 N2-methylase RlmL